MEPVPRNRFVRQVSLEVMQVMPASTHQVTANVADVLEKNSLYLGLATIVVVLCVLGILIAGCMGIYVMCNLLGGLEFDESSSDWKGTTCTITSKKMECCCCSDDDGLSFCSMYAGSPSWFGSDNEPDPAGRKLLGVAEVFTGSVPCFWQGFRPALGVTYTDNSTGVASFSSRYANWGWGHEDDMRAWMDKMNVGSSLPCLVDPADAGHVKMDPDAYPTSMEFVFLPLFVSVLLSVIFCGCCTTLAIGGSSMHRHEGYTSMSEGDEHDA